MSKRKTADGVGSLGTWRPLLDAIERMKQQLTCSLCNGLLEKSALLPCNHVVCSACITYSTGKTCVCASCKWHFHYEGVKPAKHMDRIVRLYKKMDAAIPADARQKSVIRASPDQEEGHPRPLFGDEHDSDICILDEGADRELSQRPYLLTSVSRHPKALSKSIVKECNVRHTDGVNKSKRLRRNLQMPFVLKPEYLFGDECAFCHSLRSTKISGPMMCYIAGKLVPRSRTVESGVILVHQKCAVWAPKVHYEGISLRNLEVELQRSSKLKCSKCGKNGATLGCYYKNCQSTFHVPCVITVPECRWDCDNLCVLCPSHTSEWLPCDVIFSQKKAEDESTPEIIEFPGSPGKLVADDQICRFKEVTCSKQKSQELSHRQKFSTSVSRHSVKPSNYVAKEYRSQSASAKQFKKHKGHLIRQSVPKTIYLFGDECAFCHSFRNKVASGPMMCYIDGKLVPHNSATKSDGILVHQKCAVWAPRAYFEGETLKNLEAELSRSSRLKCSKCRLSGAALGCYLRSCNKSFHVACAVAIPECRWDTDNLFMLCPSHTSERPPCDAIVSQKKIEEELPLVQTLKLPSCPEKLTAKGQSNRRQMTFLGSDLLEPVFQELLRDFVSWTGEAIAEKWTDDVTHVIVATGENGACKRTYEVLMAILTGKWILETRWIEACLDSGQLVPEEPYEVCLDVRGIRDGPKKGRLRAIQKARKLFLGMRFCFSEHFTSSCKQRLEELAVAAGGRVVLPSSKVESCSSRTSEMYFVYNEDPSSSVAAD